MAVPLQLVLQSARSPVNLRNRMEETTASHATHHPVPAQWARSVFLALLPVLAVFLGGRWINKVKDFLKVRCRLALMPFLIRCLIGLELIASLPQLKRKILLIFLTMSLFRLM